ncbi:MAG: oligosaccharide flippase family protein [Bacteroidales bacterium]|nr:oligosaccharide flippase family protein [Bacteroidales bacterium]
MKLQNLKKSEIFINTSTLVSGTAIAQLIPILLQPVLRRFYSPEIFGAYAVYLSMVGILVIVTSFRYELAIILPKRDKDAANVLFLAQLFNLVINILLFILILIFSRRLLRLLNLDSSYVLFLYLVPAGTFLFSLYQSLNYWLIRKKSFFRVSLNKFVRRSFEGSFQILFKWTGISGGLIFGDLIGHAANNISGLFQSLQLNLKLQDFSIVKLNYVFKKYIDYPKYNLVTSFMSACSYLLPIILINKFFSSETAGYFDLSKLVLSVPFALVASSISNVLLQRTSEKYKKQKSFRKELVSIFFVVFAIALIEILVILYFGVDLFQLFFGKDWTFSGQISQILVWSYALNFITSSFSSIFISLNKIKHLSIWQITYFVSIVSLILFRNFEFITFIKIYVIIEVICYTLNITFLFSIIKNYETKIYENG